MSEQAQDVNQGSCRQWLPKHFGRPDSVCFAVSGRAQLCFYGSRKARHSRRLLSRNRSTWTSTARLAVTRHRALPRLKRITRAEHRMRVYISSFLMSSPSSFFSIVMPSTTGQASRLTSVKVSCVEHIGPAGDDPETTKSRDPSTRVTTQTEGSCGRISLLLSLTHERGEMVLEDTIAEASRS